LGSKGAKPTLKVKYYINVTGIKKLRIFLNTSKRRKWRPSNCKGFVRKPKMGKGSIKIASTQNATRQLNWLPTYTLFENLKLIDFKIIIEQRQLNNKYES